MLFLVIDVGTSDCRAAVVSGNGEILSQSRTPVRLDRPRPSFAEIDCDKIWALVQKVVLAEVEKHPGTTFDCIGVSAMLGYVLLDKHGQPLLPAVTYADNRAAAEAEAIRRLIPDEKFLAATGRRASPLLLAPKLMWLARHRPDAAGKLDYVIGIKDDVVRRFCGNIGTDIAHLDYSGVYNIHQGKPDSDILDTLGLEPNLLAAPTVATAIAGTVTAAAAGQMNLTSGTPVITGSSDGTTAMYGAGILEGGNAVLVSGTTDVLMTGSTSPPANPGRELCTNSGMLPETYLVGGPSGMSGGSLKYFEDLLQTSSAELELPIRQIPPGSGGLLVFPGLTGERSPYWKAHWRGSLAGLNPGHRREHILRAVMEGCALRNAGLLTTLSENGLHPRRLNLVGGGSASDAWNQIRADACGMVVQKMLTAEATCLGTAIFCRAALDRSQPLETIAASWIKIAKRYEPDPEHTEVYQQMAALFERYIDINSDFYQRMNEVMA
jgi:sugar (pentulose or hexulose) kinase